MLGPSGSGKTTVLRMIAGFESRPPARVLLRRSRGLAPRAYDRDVNTVFQDYALFPHMDVRENVEYGLRVKGVGKADRRRRARSRRWRACGSAATATRRPASSPAASGSGWRWPASCVEPAQGAPARRAARRARPQAPRGDAGRAEGHPARGRHHLRLRHPRPARGAVHERPGRGVQPRLHRAGRHAREIYERPASVFVAGFVGTTNVLRGVPGPPMGRPACAPCGRRASHHRPGEAVAGHVSRCPPRSGILYLGGRHPVVGRPGRWRQPRGHPPRRRSKRRDVAPGTPGPAWCRNTTTCSSWPATYGIAANPHGGRQHRGPDHRRHHRNGGTPSTITHTRRESTT